MEGRDRHEEQMAPSISETVSGGGGGGGSFRTQNIPELIMLLK